MLLIQTAYQKVKGLGLPCAVVLRILAGVVLDVRANGAASGLKQGGGSARRAVSASGLSAGTNTISPDLRRDTHTLKWTLTECWEPI